MTLPIHRAVTAVFIMLIIPIWSYAQDHPGHEFRNFSLTFNGGASLGDTNRGEYLLSSNLSVNTKEAFTFGTSVQYALTPAWSIELGYQRAQITGLDTSFETKLNQLSFRNIINLNQILLINIITERINPYVTVGVGYDMYNYRNTDIEVYNHSSSYNLGAGMAYKLSNTIDLFALYDFHIGSNDIDNDTEGWGADLINSLTGGIRFNFGKSHAIHPSWKPFPVGLSRNDYDTLMGQEARIKMLSDQIAMLKTQNSKEHAQMDIAIANNNAEIDSLKWRMTLLEERMDDLEFALTNLQGTLSPVATNTETEVAELLPAGHYVQLFATYHLPIAERVRNQAIASLKDEFPDRQDNIFIIKRKQFYEVLIGMLTEFNDASSIQQLMTPFHEDAYVISFPRPVNLNMDFEDLKVLQKENNR
jgi:opacity protein-like surface antigen